MMRRMKYIHVDVDLIENVMWTRNGSVKTR